LWQLAGQVQAACVMATSSGGRLQFTENSRHVLQIKFQGNQEGMLDCGCASALSNALYRFDTIQEFVTELAAVTGVGLGDIGLDYDPGTKSFAFNLEFDRAFQRELHLHFLEELATPVGTLSLAGGAHAHIDASVALDIRVGFDLSPVGEGFALQPTTSLDSLTNGAFPTAGSGKNDFKITSANGSSIEISLFGAATIQDVIDRVNAGGHVTLAIDPSNPA